METTKWSRCVPAGRFIKAITLMAALVLTFLLLVAPVNAADDKSEDETAIGVYVMPAQNNIDLKNGQVYKGELKVRNMGTSTATFDIEATPYTIKDNKYNTPDYASESKYSLMNKWITLDQKQVTVEPNGVKSVGYTITVPDNPPSGTQYATVAASVNPSKSDVTNIKVAVRAAMIIKADMVDGKTIDRTNITEQKIDGYQPESPLTSSFAIKNEGNTGAAIEYSMTVKSLFGKTVYQTKPATLGMYPETSRSFTLKWDGSRIGIYNVEQNVKIDGRDHIIKKLVIAVPIWIFILVIVAILAIVAFVAINTKSSDKKTKKKATRKKK